MPDKHFQEKGFLPVMAGPQLIKEQENKKDTAVNQIGVTDTNTQKRVHAAEKLTCPYTLTALGKETCHQQKHASSTEPLIKTGASLAKCVSKNGLCVCA